MENGGHVQVEEHGYGKLRSRALIPSEKLLNVIDHVTHCGWHECNDRYSIRRDNVTSRVGDYLVIFTLSGVGEASVGTEEYRIEPGTVMLFPKDVPHYYGVSAGGRWEFYWMHISGGSCGAMLDYLIREYGSLLKVSCMGELADCMEKLIDAEMSYQEYELFAAKTIGEILYRLMDSAMKPPGTDKGRGGLAVKVIDLIERSGAKLLTVEEIGARLYLSPEHVIRVFKQETGMTPRQYMKRLRMRRACIYLEESDMSVEEIARATGCRSVSTFIAEFKRRYSVTPRTYRSSHIVRKDADKTEGENI